MNAWRRVLVGWAIGSSAAFSALGAPASGDAVAVEKVIRSQLSAFAHDDAAKAFSYASPTTRKMFGSAEGFMKTVRESYGAVYRASSVTFESLQRVGGQVYQPVQIAGPDGKVWRAVYDMQKQPDGSWKINGCQLESTPVLAT